MRVLILDTRPGRAPLVQKEGARLYAALRRAGHDPQLAGPGITEDLTRIPALAEDFDFCVLCDNYPEVWPWKTSFRAIKIPKAFWAVDTHLRRFEFVVTEGFDYALFNNYSHMDRFMSGYGWERCLRGCAFFPYAIDTTFPADLEGTSRYRTNAPEHRDVAFCGTMDRLRRRKIRRFQRRSMRTVDVLVGFGQDYIDNILSSRIHVNFPISDDFNGKIVEILSLKRLVLSEYNSNSAAVVPRRSESISGLSGKRPSSRMDILKMSDFEKQLCRESIVTSRTVIPTIDESKR